MASIYCPDRALDDEGLEKLDKEVKVLRCRGSRAGRRARGAVGKKEDESVSTLGAAATSDDPVWQQVYKEHMMPGKPENYDQASNALRSLTAADLHSPILVGEVCS